MHGSLDFFDFGNIVKEWTKILYHDFSVKIQNNGHFSSTINIKKGVHQGGCCSSVYFLVIAEILELALRSNSQIDGITIKDIRNLLNQFADDMDVFTEGNKNSIAAIYEELDRFKYQSGFEVSYDKTTLYRIGSLRHSDAALYDLENYKWSNQDICVLGVTIAHEDVITKNYEPLVEKTRKILNSWGNRGLSLIGKVQVVNTLVASLYVYKMMVLPEIPKRIVKCVDNLIREFIWNGKKSKIAYSILQNSKKEGGLELVNLTKKDRALKATWPIILSQEIEYSTIVYSFMRCSPLNENIWRCSLSPDDVDILKIRNRFWEEVLRNWCEYNYYYKRRIDNQILWYNSRIRIQDKPFLWADCKENGLVYVHQLFQGSSFKSEEDVMREFGLTRMRYNGIKAALPKEWKNYFMQTVKTEYLPLYPHNYDYWLLRKGKGLSSHVYKYMAEDVLLIHNKFLKWKQDLGPSYSDGLVEYGLKHMDIYRVTNIVKYRSFQYRLLQRGLVTNIQLYKWGVVDSELCSFCNLEQETLMHLFCRCTEVQDLWKKVFSYCREQFNIELQFNEEAVIFNNLVKNKLSAVNFVCLVVKQYIYRQRCLKKNLCFQSLKGIIQYLRNIEKYIAIKNGKIVKHVKKWQQVPNHEPINEYLLLYMDQV